MLAALGDDPARGLAAKNVGRAKLAHGIPEVWKGGGNPAPAARGNPAASVTTEKEACRPSDSG